ncbi:MAG: hypothetical protein KDA96_01835 [Planctomycetaceae bacterium]|nr:hypothetical protein [Planctomycetaceae bacterium]
MRFYYVYKALAHPENNDYVPPFTLAERLMHVQEAKQKTGSRIPWLCDSMQNDLKHAMGDRPNSEFIVDPEGRIIVSRDWSSPDDLRQDLTELVGAPARVTTVAELDMKPVPPAHAAPTGIVSRLTLPSGMVPLQVEPVIRAEDQPFYVKLRAEGDAELLQTGTGKLYLGFMLDPLYHVHWNNDAMPVMFEVTKSTGLVAGTTEGEAAEVDAPADADPREFLMDVCGYLVEPGQQFTQELTIQVRYFACDDAQTFCKPVTQTYVIRLQRDRDGGARRTGGRPGNLNRRPFQREASPLIQPGSAPGQRGNAADREAMMRRRQLLQRRRQMQQ